MTWLFSKAMMEHCVNLLCSPEGAAESLVVTFSDGKPFAQLNVMPTPQQFWRNDKMMESSRLSQFGLTLQLLTESRGEALLMLYRGAGLVRTFPLLAVARDSTATAADYGWKCAGSFARYSHDSRTWKTRQCSLVADSDEFLETWPKWGSMRSGVCLERETSDFPMFESESGYVPTPVATDYKGARSPEALAAAGRNERNNLRDFLRARLGWKMPAPDGSECLMGWTVGWTDLKPLVMDRFQGWQQQHSLNLSVDLSKAA